MAEPFKNAFNKEAISKMAGHIFRVAPEFDEKAFIDFACDGLEDLELKQRSSQITEALVKFLPVEFGKAVDILLQSLDVNIDDVLSYEQTEEGIRGWLIMPMADYIALKGMDNLSLSM